MENRYIRNGYVLIPMPSHHRAEDNGLVYEHIYLSELYLNRKLKDKYGLPHLKKI